MWIILRLEFIQTLCSTWYFPTNYEMITDLNSYKDAGHYDMEIQYQIFKEMRDGDNRLTKDNYQEYMEDFKTMVMDCDFSKIMQ